MRSKGALRAYRSRSSRPCQCSDQTMCPLGRMLSEVLGFLESLSIKVFEASLVQRSIKEPRRVGIERGLTVP
jgi:hypothetical protein